MSSSGVYRFLRMTLTSLVVVQSNTYPGPHFPWQVLVTKRFAAVRVLPACAGVSIVEG